MTLEEAWSEYKTSLRAFLRSKISNSEDVEDLLQEILIKTHKNIGTLKEATSIKSWLFQIANRTVIDHYRKNNSAQEIDTTFLWGQEESQNIKAELSVCIEPFIQTLPQDSADLLRSVDIEGHSQKQYAQKLNMSYSTLKSRVQKARSELRLQFDKCCHYTIDKHGNLIDFEQKDKNCNNC